MRRLNSTNDNGWASPPFKGDWSSPRAYARSGFSSSPSWLNDRWRFNRRGDDRGVASSMRDGENSSAHVSWRSSSLHRGSSIGAYTMFLLSFNRSSRFGTSTGGCSWSASCSLRACLYFRGGDHGGNTPLNLFIHDEGTRASVCQGRG